ncbi:hypothetical protein C9374_010992 [Naegleria lovaniensis]|uniref:NmrA-like domain-containing protein n=1 Tax=Naegleria lovaniensis TaxID=51637 RepID=A0AA88GEU6_NAELO|nr:uncharacterized protein C9374_010992 [Naegleria lovaniensis]KAG2374155.1 hypothetical protein C9374_010992 [Naegleria lovaniensis]
MSSSKAIKSICVINGGGRLGRNILQSLVNIRENKSQLNISSNSSKSSQVDPSFKIFTFVTPDRKDTFNSEGFVKQLDGVTVERTDGLGRKELRDRFAKYDVLINATDFEKSYNEEEYESNVIEACFDGNVKRYIPADFTVDFNNFQNGECEKMEIRKRIRSLLEKNQSKMSFTSILNGVFLERLFDPFYKWKILNLEEQLVEYYGKDNSDKVPMIDFSLYPEVGQLCALTSTLLFDQTSNKTIPYVSQSYDMNELAEMLTNDLGHGKWKVKKIGTLKDLEKKIAERKSHRIQKMDENVDEEFAWDYLYAIFSEKGRLSQATSTEYQSIKDVVERFSSVISPLKGKEEMTPSVTSSGLERKDLFHKMVGDQQVDKETLTKMCSSAGCGYVQVATDSTSKIRPTGAPIKEGP